MLDREDERAAIERVLDEVRGGFTGTLVLRGGPGVGKTILLEYAIDEASDLQIARVAGVQSEISMAFGAVHQLLVPFLPLLDVLPAPQRHALGVAFGLEAGPPDRFLVGLAALTVLSRAAEEKPVLCVIDDAHWLDTESAQALGFVARRLYADRVGMITAVGEPDTQHEFDQFPGVVVGPLPDAEAAELLRKVAGGPLNDQVVGRVLADTQRNPLALVELGAELTIVAVADLCARDYDAAVTAALTVVEDDPAFTAELALPELVEAASRAGNRKTATWAFGILSERAQPPGHHGHSACAPAARPCSMTARMPRTPTPSPSAS